MGGDFNLDQISAARFLLKAWIRNGLLRADEDAPTFRRLTKGSVQESSIAHIVWTGTARSGAYVLDDGDFATDHIPLIGWVDVHAKRSTIVRTGFSWIPRFKPGDKKSASRFKKRIGDILSGMDMGSVSMKDLVDMSLEVSMELGKKRESNSSSWSPLSRVLDIQKRILGTAIKAYHKTSYNIIIRKNLKEARRDLDKMVLSTEEQSWLKDNVGEIPLDWTHWQIEYPSKELLLRAFVAHQNNLTEARRKDLRILHGGKMKKLQEAADEGKIGAILKKNCGRQAPLLSG